MPPPARRPPLFFREGTSPVPCLSFQESSFTTLILTFYRKQPWAEIGKSVRGLKLDQRVGLEAGNRHPGKEYPGRWSPAEGLKFTENSPRLKSATENAKGFPVKPHPHTPVKDRATILALNPPSYPQQKRAEAYQARCRAKGVKNPF